MVKTRKQEQTDLEYTHSSLPLKIYTLGRFSVLLNDRSFNGSGKTARKPLEMLKALIALGARDVSETRICAALWPDADGDHAHSAFTTTLSRLRKMIGRELLLFDSGQLSLSDQLCWVDYWAFERTLSDLELLLSKNTSDTRQDIQSGSARIFALYRGAFMVKEPTKGWMLPIRERLHSKFMRIIRLLIQYYRDSGGHCQSVITLYEKARELDPLSESYCRGLMRCYSARGNRSEALALFERCQQIMNQTFGIQPSNKTLQLYELIKADPDQDFGFCELCEQAAK